MLFQDRREAGRELAARAAPLAAERPTVVAMLPGGVAVGFEVARALRAPLDVVALRELDTSCRREIGVAAASAEAALVGAGPKPWPIEIEAILAFEVEEAIREVRRYRDAAVQRDIRGLTVLLVDDGIHSMAAVVAAARLVRNRGARRVVLLTPFCAFECEQAGAHVDEIVCADDPCNHRGWYSDPAGTSDVEVKALLLLASARASCAVGSEVG